MSTTAVMTEGGLGRGCRRKARKILKRTSRRRGRHCFHIFGFLSQSTSVMASFREFRSILLQSFDEGDILEDEFLLLYDVNTSKNSDFPYESYGKFDLNDVDDSECLSEFRFRKSDLPVLSEALHLPYHFTRKQGAICSGIEGLRIALRRFAYSCRLSDLIPRFGRPGPELSRISSLVVETIYQKHNHRITQWNDTLLNPGTQNGQCLTLSL